jgi:hypothetical protein
MTLRARALLGLLLCVAWTASADPAPPGTARLPAKGRITDGVTGLPLAGVRVSGPDGAFAISDVHGDYRLEGLPNGLSTLVLASPDHPVATRSILTFAEPKLASLAQELGGTDLALWPHTPRRSALPVQLRAGEDALVATPEPRLALQLPARSLRTDAVMTLALPEPSPTRNGDVLPLNDVLAKSAPLGIVAVGPEIEMRITHPTEAPEPLPILGPIVAMGFYTAAEAASAAEAGVAEHAIALWVHDGRLWWPLRRVPYVHAVDLENRVVGTMVLWGDVESEGTPPRATAAMTETFLGGRVRLRLAGPPRTP